MVMVAVNAQKSYPARPTRYQAEPGLHTRVDATTGPIVIMVHGMKYAPHCPKLCPHQFIFAFTPKRHRKGIRSWPRHLGFTENCDGLVIGFGWPAGDKLYQAFNEAPHSGEALACFIEDLKRHAPERQIQVICHSMGARVFLSALPYLKARSVQRAVIMSGAELRNNARDAQATEAGRKVEIFNITSRENDIFDFLLEVAISPFSGKTAAIGRGLGKDFDNWIDIQMDQKETLNALAGIGFRIAPPTRRICHWSPYIRPGMFPFYRRLLRNPERLPAALLATHLPDKTSARWSRLFALPHRFRALPFIQKL